MKRLVWLLLAATGVVLSPVAPVCATMQPPASMTSEMSCCRTDRTCGHGESSAAGSGKSARECAACLPCAAMGCLAILPATDIAALPLSPVARLHAAGEQGPARNDPPPLPPPRLRA